MKQYDFTLKFALGHPDADPQEFVERLYGEGCDDALIGVGKHGYIALDFSRDANSAADAVLSAITDVKRIIPDAKITEVAPDLVGVPDMAELFGISRQGFAKLLEKHTQNFPPAVSSGTRSIWHLVTVVEYLVNNRVREVDDSLREIARVNMLLNRALEKQRYPVEIPDIYLRAIG